MSTTTGSNAPLSQLNDTPAELSTGLVRLKHIILALLLSVVFPCFLFYCASCLYCLGFVESDGCSALLQSQAC